MSLLHWLRNLTSRKSMRTTKTVKPTRWRHYLPRLELLETRLAPATSINILATGAGSLDSTFAANNGVIVVTDGGMGGTQAETLSAAALEAANASTNISIAARTSITFNDQGGTPLALQTGLGHSDTFQVLGPTAAAITFSNIGNTLSSNGGTLNFTAGTNLTVANLDAGGGNINLTAGTNGAGNISARALLTQGNGNITLTATNAAGGTVTQTGLFTGQAINVTATGSVVVDQVKGTTVTLTSNSGLVASLGSNPIQASAQLTLSAAAGIAVTTLATALQATNSTSGNIIVFQSAAATQALTTGGSGVINNAAGFTISIINLGSTITVAAGAPITSNNGAITLLATDFTILNTINSGATITTLGNSQAGTAIDLGTDNVFGKISLTQAELDFVTASLLRIGTPTAGSITISNAITAPASVNGALSLINNGSIIETTGPNVGTLTAANLRVSSAGPVALTNVNNITNGGPAPAGLSASITGPGNSFTLNNGTNTLRIPNAGFDGVLGVTTNNGNVTLEADNILIQQVVTPGTATVLLEPFTTSLPITVGTASVPATTFGITNGGLGWITSGITQVGTFLDTGGLSVTGAINRTPTNTAPSRSQTLVLENNGAITQTAALSVANLDAESNTSVILNNAGNDVEKLAGFAGGGGNFVFVDVDDLITDTVAGDTQIHADNDVRITTGTTLTINQLVESFNTFVSLTAGAAATEGPNGRIDAPALELLGAGPYTLTNVNNDVVTLAALVTNAVTYVDADALNIATVNATNGVTTTNSAINISTVDGNLTVFDTVPAGPDVNAGNSTVALTAGSNFDDRLLDIQANAGVTGTGGVTLTGDHMSIAAAVDAGPKTALLQPFTTGQLIDLGGADGFGTLGLTAAEINFVTAAVIQVGRSTAGDLSITAQIQPTGSNQLELITGDHIIDRHAATADLIVTRLGLTAGSGIGFDGGTVDDIETQVSNLEATTNSGGVHIINSGAGVLTIGGVNGTLAGVQVTGASGDITITNDNTININQNGQIVKGPANVTLTANGATSNIVTGGNNGQPNQAGAVASTGAASTTTLNAGQDILIGDATSGNPGFGDVIGGGSIVLNAARDIIIDRSSFVDAHGAGTITGTAGRNVSLLVQVNGIGDQIRTEGGAIVLSSTAMNGLLTVASGAGTGTITTAQNPANGFGNVTLNFDRVSIGPTDGIAVGTAIVTFNQVSPAWPINLGTVGDPNGSLNLSDAELDRITAGAVRIGDPANTGNITVTAPITAPATYSTLHLLTGGSIGNTNAGTDITVPNLALQAVAGIALDTQLVAPGNLPGTLAFTNASGAVTINSTGGFTVTAVDGVTPSSNNGGTSTTTVLTATGGPITFAVNVTSRGSLSATTIEGSPDGVGPNEENLTVNAGVTVRSFTGNVVLTAADSLTLAAGSTVMADAGSVTLQAGIGDTDNDATMTLNGTISSANGITILASGDIVLTAPISAPGQTVTITSTNGAILDGNDIPSGTPVLNINANLLALSAFTGIGRTNASNPTINATDAPLETQVNSLEAQTATGGIFITNNSLAASNPLNIGGVTGAINGVRVTGASGAISLTNNGSINIITFGEIVKGPGAVSVTATGAGSDVLTGGGNNLSFGAIVSTGGTTTITAARDILIGNPGGGPGNRIGDVQGGGSIVLSAGRNIVVDVDSFVDAHGIGTATVTAGTAGGGGDISILHSGAPPLTGARISTEGGLLTVTTGANGTLTVDGDSGINTISTTQNLGNGNIVINADHVNLTTLDSINAGTAIVTIQQVTGAEAINLGAVTDAELDLSNAEINEITASTVRIGATSNSGSITVSAAISDTTTFSALHLRTGGSISESAGGTLTVTNLALEAVVAVSANNANDAVTLAGKVTGASNAFAYTDANSVDVGSVDAIDGVSTNGGALAITSGGTLTVTNTPAANDIGSAGGAITLTANTFINNASAAIVSGGGNIIVAANNTVLTAGSTINSAAGRTTLRERTAGTPIDLGGPDTAVPVLGLTNAEINTVTAGVIQVGDQNAGPMSITAAIAPTHTTTLDLESGSTITETSAAGTVTIANLAIRSVGSVTMSSANDVTGASLAANVTGNGSSFVYNDANNLVIGTADGLNGITTNNGVIAVTSSSGSITVNQPVSSGAANITLTALGTDNFINNNSAISNTTGNRITLQANEMALNPGSTITAAGAGARVVLEASTAGRLVNLGSTIDPNGSLNLSNAELNTIAVTGGVLQIGNGIEGNVTVGAQTVINVQAVTQTLTINTAGAILGSGTITVNSLRLSAGSNGVNLPGPNNIAFLAGADSVGAQAFLFNNTNAGLTIDTVDGVSGITTTNGAVTVSATGAITVNQNISAGTAPVILTVDTLNGLFTNNAAITGGSATITADRMALGSTPTDSISVGSGPTNIVILQPFTAGEVVNLDNTAGDPNGELRISQNELNTITAGVLRIGSTAAGNLTIKNPVVTPGPAALSLISGGTITQSSTANIITATNLALQAAGLVNIGGHNVVVQLAGSSTGGAFSFTDNHDLNVGSVDSVNGITGSGADVTLIVENPSLINTDPGLLTVTNAITNLGGNIRLTADNMALNAILNAGTGSVFLNRFDTVVTSITLGSADSAGTLGLTNAELSEVNAALLQIGSTSIATFIVVSTNISNTSYTTLALQTTGSLSESGGSRVSGTNLSLNVGLVPTNPFLIGESSVAATVANGSIALSNNTPTGLTVSGTALDGVTGVTATAGGATVNVTTTAGPLTIAGNILANSTITLQTTETVVDVTEENLTVNSGVTVESTAGNVVLISGDSINLQSNSLIKSDSGSISLTFGNGDTDNDATLTFNGSLNAATGVSITGPGDIVLGSTSSASGTLSFTSTNGSIRDDGIDTTFISAPNISLTAARAIGGDIPIALNDVLTQDATFRQAIDFKLLGGTLSISQTGAGGNIQLRDVDGTFNSAVFTGSAYPTPVGSGNQLALIAAGGAIGGTSIGDLLINAALTLAGANNVNLLLAATTGNNVTVTSAVTDNGATGPVTLVSAGGHVTVSAAVNAGSPITLVATGTNSFINNNAAIGNTGGKLITLQANEMALNLGSSITASGGGRVILEASTTGRLVNLGAIGDPNGALNLSSAELQTITTTGVLQVGSGIEGNVTISNAIAVTAPTLDLTTGGSVGETGAGAVTVTNLAVLATNGADLSSNASAVSNVAASTPGVGFALLDSIPLTVSTVDGTSGIGSKSVRLLSSVANTLLTVNQAVTSTLTGIDFMFDNIAVNAAVTATTFAPSVVLEPFSAGQLIDLGGADAAGTLGLTNTELSRISSGILRIGNATAGNLTNSAAVSGIGHFATLTLISNGTIGQSGVGAITVVNLDLQGAGGVNLITNPNTVTGSLAGTTSNQTFNFTNSTTLTLGTVDGQSGINVGSGSAGIRANNSAILNGLAAGNVVTAASLGLNGLGGLGTSASPLVLAVDSLTTKSGNAAEFLASAGTTSINALNAVAGGTGGIVLTSGTFALSSSNQISATSPVRLAGATLNVGAFSNTLASLTLSASSTLGFLINSFNAGGFGNLTVNQFGYNLGNATLNLTLKAGFVPPPSGAVITLIHNANNAGVAGNFAGLPEGTVFMVGGFSFRISYLGNGTHDVTLTKV